MDSVTHHAEPHRQFVEAERVIAAGDTLLKATLNVPMGAQGIVALLHASSVGRFGVESRFASEVLAQAGFATLQVDLLTPAEDADLSSSRHSEQCVSLLLSRVLVAVDWLANQRDTVGLAIGLFTSRIEAIPALMAAERDRRVAAVVSRGGCPDFAQDAVAELHVPTLLIVGRAEQARAAELASEFFARRLTSRSDIV